MRPWLVLATMGAALLAAAPASAGPAWLPAAPVPDEATPARRAQVAFGLDGTLVAVWHSGAGGTQTIQTATRPPGRPFLPVETLAGPGPGIGSPRLAIDDQGTTLVTWAEVATPRFAVRPAGGAFGPADDLPHPTGENLNSGVEVTFDAQGNALAAWIGSEPRMGGGDDKRLRATVRPPGGSFGPTQVLDNGFDNPDVPGTPSYDLNTLNVASAGAGDLIASWARLCCFVGSVTASARVAVRPPGGPFGPTHTVDSMPSAMGTNLSSPSLAGSAQGSAVLAWVKQLGPPSGRVFACVRPPGGTFEGCTVENVSEFGPLPVAPDVGLDAQGNAVAAWNRDLPSFSDPDAVQTAGRAAGASGWTPLGTYSEPAVGLTQPTLAASAQGGALLAWRRGTDRIDGAARAPGGAFGPSQPLSASAGNPVFPDVAMDPDGNGAAAWERGALPDTLVEIAGYDGAGPRLALSVPPGGATGRPITFGVTALDSWSPVPSIDWSLGDGSSASGAQVTHTYRGRGGEITVGVTATDALGNASSASALTRLRDGIRPILSRLRMLRRLFAVGRLRTLLVSQRVRRGSAFRFRLSERATVRIRIERKRRGRYRRVATLTRRARRAGANSVKFSGRIRRRALKPGPYRATLRATDASGNRSRPRRVRFRIAR